LLHDASAAEDALGIGSGTVDISLYTVFVP
jgi:hypothetical protein